jgi:hypothetical protein
LLVAAEWLFLAGVALIPVMQPWSGDAFGAVVIPADVCFLAAGVCWVVPLLRARLRPVLGWFPLAALGYLAVMMIAALASPTRRDSFERIAIDAYVVGLGILSFGMSEGARGRDRVARAWLAGTAATVVVALVGVVLFYAGRRTPHENFAVSVFGSVPAGDYPRVRGLFLNANMFCGFLIAGLLFALGVLGTRRGGARVAIGAIAVVIILTFSPGIGGALLAVALWCVLAYQEVWSARTRGAVALAGAVGAVTFVVLAATIGPRGGTWSDAFRTFLDHPFDGVGPGNAVAATFGDGTFFVDAHDAWLSLAGQAGVLGLVGFAAVVATVCLAAWKARPLARVIEPVRAGWCAFVGSVLFVSISMSLEQTRYVWVLMGTVVAGLTAVARERGGQSFGAAMTSSPPRKGWSTSGTTKEPSGSW